MQLGIGLGLTDVRSVGGGAPVPQDLTAVVTPLAASTQVKRNSGDTDWVNTANALVDDATAATVGLISNARSSFIPLTFNNTSIPANALITGVTITLRIGADGGGVTLDNLYLSDAVGNEPSGMPMYNAATVISTGVTTINLGGVGQLFGLPLIPSAFNSGLVGMFLGLKRGSGTGTRTVSLEYATMTVHYTTTLGKAGVPKAALCTVMMRNGSLWTANTAKRSRVFFPSMGTPAAVMYWGANTRGEFANDTIKAGNYSGIFSQVGFSVPGKQAGSWRSSNPAVTAFDASGASTHSEQAVPSGQSGHGPQTPNYTISSRFNNVLRANIDTFGDGYVDAIATSALGNDDFILHVIGFFGVSAHLYNEEGWGSVEGPRTITTGFNPDLLLTNSHDQPNSAAHGAYGMLGLGAARRSGGTWTQASALQVFATRHTVAGVSQAMTDSLNILALRNDAMSDQINTNDPTAIEPVYERCTIGVTGSDATSYTMDPVAGSDRNINETGDTVLAIGGLGNSFVGFVDTPTSTGSWTPSVGFRPDLVLAYGTLGTAIERTQDVSDLADNSTWFAAGSCGEAFTIGYHLPNAQLPGTALPAATYLNRGGFQIKSGTFASPVDRVVASFTRMTATGPLMNATTVDATPRKMLVVALS
jgi:hypothetical protein